MGSLIERLTYIYLLCIAREPFKWPIVFKSSACSISLAFIQIRLYCFSFRLVFDSLFGEFTKWRSLPFRCYVKRTYGARNMKICVFWDESAQSSVETYRLREKKTNKNKISWRGGFEAMLEHLFLIGNFVFSFSVSNACTAYIV